MRKVAGILLFVVLVVAGCGDDGPLPGSEAGLSGLSINSVTLSPAFDPAVTNYTVPVYLENYTSSLYLNVTLADPKASVAYFPAQNAPLTEGSNQLRIRVTAEDGTSVREYRILVYRKGVNYFSSTNIDMLFYVPGGFYQRDNIAANISYVSPFRMGGYEITRAQFSNVMHADPSYTNHSSGVYDPVQNVSWYQAIAFCNKLSLREGLTPVYSIAGVDFATLAFEAIPTTNDSVWNGTTATWTANGYRLPTEMEWRWAAMGAQVGGNPFSVNTNGRNKPFSGSSGTNLIGAYAVFGYWGTEDGRTAYMHTNPGGTRMPNELGLNDMSGNVWELCWDLYNTWPSGYVPDYRGADIPVSTFDYLHVRWGGSWQSDGSQCSLLIVNRDGYAAALTSAVNGFRVARN